MLPGQIIEVFSDDPGVKTDFPLWCSRTGNTLLTISEENDVYRALIRKE